MNFFLRASSQHQVGFQVGANWLTHMHVYLLALRRRGLGEKPHEKLEGPLCISSAEFLNLDCFFSSRFRFVPSLLNFVFACFAARDAPPIPVSFDSNNKEITKINKIRKKQRQSMRNQKVKLIFLAEFSFSSLSFCPSWLIWSVLWSAYLCFRLRFLIICHCLSYNI